MRWCFFSPLKPEHLGSGFTGPLCEENINDCIPEPCHHGVCNDGIATFSCECHAGYTGSICNIQIQECHSNPCQNRGRCIDLVNAYQCNCPPGTTGMRSCAAALCLSPKKGNFHFYTQPSITKHCGKFKANDCS